MVKNVAIRAEQSRHLVLSTYNMFYILERNINVKYFDMSQYQRMIWMGVIQHVWKTEAPGHNTLAPFHSPTRLVQSPII